MQTLQIIPQSPTGYALNTARGALSVVVAEATTNLVTNPSFELNATSWTTFPGLAAITRLTSGTHGQYCGSATPGVKTSSGLRYSLPVRTTLDGIYTLSFNVAAELGATITARILTTVVATVTGRGQDVFFRVECRPITVVAGGEATIDILRTTTSSGLTDIIKVDAVQLEKKAYATTYCDGDQLGFLPGELVYFWSGAAHGSDSFRLDTTNHGGKIVNLQTFGLYVLSILGLGLAPFNLIAPRVSTGGAYFQRAVIQPRSLSLVADISATSEQALDQQRTLAARYFSPQNQLVSQPIKLIYENYAQDGATPVSVRSELTAHYSGGLEGNRSGLYQERVAPEFQMFIPLISSSITSAQALTDQAFVGSVNRIMRRDREGNWEIAGTGAASGAVFVLHQSSDGNIYAGGSFSSMGGVASTLGIAKWSPDTETWTAVGTGAASGTVYVITEDAAGALYVGGTFPTMGGIAATNLIAKYTPSTNTWSSISASASAASEVRAIAISPGGVVFIGGTFTTLGATAANRIIRFTPATSAWSAISTGLNVGVYSLAITNNSTDVLVYVGGDFTTAGGVAAPKIAAWNVTDSVWQAVGGGVAGVGIVFALAVGGDGVLYLGGSFSAFGTTTAEGIATWNGTTFAQLGEGVAATGIVYDLALDGLGRLYVTGAGLVTNEAYPDSVLIWNGSVFLPSDEEMPGVSTIYAALPTTQGGLWLGFDQAGTGSIAVVTAVTYGGTAPAYPTLVFTGPTGAGGGDRVFQVVNTSTGVGIWFDLELMIGEVVTLTLDPASAAYGLKSSLRGNIVDTILAGSNLAGWQLRPGINNISVFTEDPSMTTTMTWRDQYGAVQDTVLR